MAAVEFQDENTATVLHTVLQNKLNLNQNFSQVINWLVLQAHDPLCQSYYNQQQNLKRYCCQSSKHHCSPPFKVYWHCLHPYFIDI
jgi:hypothetical protein